MQELKDKMNTLTNDYIASGEFDKFLQKTVQETINKSVENCFRSYGDLARSLEKSIEARMNIDFNQVELPEMASMIIKIAQSKIGQVLNEQAEKRFAEIMEKSLNPAPKEVKVQEIVDLVVEYVKEHGDFDGEENATVEIEQKGYGVNLKIWKGKKTRKSYSSYSSDTENEPDVDLFINKDEKVIRLIRNKESSRKTFGSDLFDYEAKIYLMYCAGTVISDIHECDVYDLNTSYQDYDD